MTFYEGEAIGWNSRKLMVEVGGRMRFRDETRIFRADTWGKKSVTCLEKSKI